MKTLQEYVDDDYGSAGIYSHVDAFTRLIQENLVPNMRVAELGVFDGATTLVNLPLIKSVDGVYYAIDWFNGTDESVWGVDHSNLESMNGIRHYYREGYEKFIYPKFLENIQATGCADICKVLKGKTSEVAHLILDKSLDICFIDAAHDYDSVRLDIQLYLPKVKDGGIICGHDYDSGHLETVKAVNEAFDNIEI